ncbi:MAG TPA: outer membrane beta-barrel protein [Bacteroidales bacterium]|nr:outer membrane beta-barrel protein [Bacteroidales bacterium]
MKTLFLTIFLIISALFVQAQPFSIKGNISDAENKGLPGATLLVLNPSDSTMLGFGITNVEGNFDIQNLGRRNYLLRITYVGFLTRYLPIAPPEGNELNLGSLLLENIRTTLSEVVVEQERVHMRVRGDTIEYNALAFNPRPNEVVEDMLKRMPGMEVQSDGNVVAQGETVSRVLVDGREFFGRDPRMATQNLPADAVERVQVFDRRSEQAQFTGIDDGERERTINLELRENRRVGTFGNSSLAYGTEDRFQGRTNINHFDTNGQISILGMGNNVNQTGFSIGEFLNFSGGMQGSGGGGGGAMQMSITRGGGGSDIPISFDGRPSTNGLMTSWAGGLNFHRRLGTSTEITASYFYNQLGHDLTQELERENFMPTGNFYFDQNSSQDSRNFNHRLNLRLLHKFSEQSSLLLTANSTLNSTETEAQNLSQTLNPQRLPQNESMQTNQAEGNRNNVDASLLWRHRLNKPGRTFTTQLNFSALGNESQGDLEALNRFFFPSLVEQLLLQSNLQNSFNRTFGGNVSFTEPLAENMFLEGNYRVSFNMNEVDQTVYDIVGQNQILNPLLTNIYNNTYLFQRGGFNYRLTGEKFNLTIGSNVQFSTLEGQILTSNQEILRQYTHVLPVVRFNYEFTTMRRLMFDYTTSVQEPSLLQLQPLVDNRDPLNIYQGNPNLKPSYRHRASLRFNSFNPLNNFGIFAFVSADYVNNAIINAVSIDEQLIRTISPVNVDRNLNLRTNVNLNMSLTPIRSRLSGGATFNHIQSVNILNDVEQQIANNILGFNTRFSFNPAEQFEAGFTANINQQLTKYEFRTLEQAFLNQTYGSDISWRFLNHYRLGLNFSYQIYEGRTDEFDRNIPMLDFSISRSFLRGNTGEIRLSGFNLLNQNLGVMQSVDANFIQRQVTNSIGQYFLLTFTYSLNQAMNMFDGANRPGQGRGMRVIMH